MNEGQRCNSFPLRFLWRTHTATWVCRIDTTNIGMRLRGERSMLKRLRAVKAIAVVSSPVRNEEKLTRKAPGSSSRPRERTHPSGTARS